MLLACVSVLSISRCERNMLRSPFSMYSVTMHKGSEDTHTHSSRMMLGSFRRDMILISFRKSFLRRERKRPHLRVEQVFKRAGGDGGEKVPVDGSRCCCIGSLTWPGWWRQPSAASRPPEPNVHPSREAANPPRGILGGPQLHTGGPAEVGQNIITASCGFLRVS